MRDASLPYDAHVKILVNLGLTVVQAKTYLALARLGEADARSISRVSHVARQDVYRVMPTLEKLGLVEKGLATPTVYKAVPLSEGYYLLLQNETQKLAKLQRKITSLIKSFCENNDNGKITLQTEGSQFVITSSRKLLFKKLFDEAFTKVQRSLDLLLQWKCAKATVFHARSNFQKALKRGVRIRILTEKRNEDESAEKIVQDLKTNPLFEVRFVPKLDDAITIIDGEEFYLCLVNPSSDILPSLWSNNFQLVKITMAYFEDKWSKATP